LEIFCQIINIKKLGEEKKRKEEVWGKAHAGKA
jgi:hypothetical protein